MNITFFVHLQVGLVVENSEDEDEDDVMLRIREVRPILSKLRAMKTTATSDNVQLLIFEFYCSL